MIEKFRREAAEGRVVVLENATHHLFRDREADVVREMNHSYGPVPC